MNPNALGHGRGHHGDARTGSRHAASCAASGSHSRRRAAIPASPMQQRPHERGHLLQLVYVAGFLFAHLWGMESIDSVNGFGKQLEILLRITGMLLLAFL